MYTCNLAFPSIDFLRRGRFVHGVHRHCPASLPCICVSRAATQRRWAVMLLCTADAYGAPCYCSCHHHRQHDAATAPVLIATLVTQHLLASATRAGAFQVGHTTAPMTQPPIGEPRAHPDRPTTVATRRSHQLPVAPRPNSKVSGRARKGEEVALSMEAAKSWIIHTCTYA